MAEYEPSTYGDRIAAIYDALYSALDERVVPLLAELARGGPALELGIGSGRVALPLQEAGVEVHGIDASEPMVARLRARPGGDGIPVTIGDFRDLAVDGKFSLIFVVFNTFFGLLSQDDQVRCFRNVAAHLATSGVFLIEAFVPDLARFDRGQTVRAMDVGTDRVALDVSQHDLANQRVTSVHIIFEGGGHNLYPVQLRYAWPGELDLMAQLAGLRLRARWDGWDRTPFTANSGRHVSIYERAP